MPLTEEEQASKREHTLFYLKQFGQDDFSLMHFMFSLRSRENIQRLVIKLSGLT